MNKRYFWVDRKSKLIMLKCAVKRENVSYVKNVYFLILKSSINIRWKVSGL